MVVIACSGVPNAAKDTLSEYLAERSFNNPNTDRYFQHLKLADPIQAITMTLIEPASELVTAKELRKQFSDRKWKETKDYLLNGVLYSPRDIQIKVGKCLKEEFGIELFADIVYNYITKASELDSLTDFVISDLRFPIEVDVLKKLPEVYFVYISNAKAEYKFINDPKHRDSEGNFLPSEAHHPFLKENADYVIENNGTIEEFYAKLDDLYSNIIGMDELVNDVTDHYRVDYT